MLEWKHGGVGGQGNSDGVMMDGMGYLATIFIVFVIFSMLRMDCHRHQHQSSHKSMEQRTGTV